MDQAQSSISEIIETDSMTAFWFALAKKEPVFSGIPTLLHDCYLCDVRLDWKEAPYVLGTIPAGTKIYALDTDVIVHLSCLRTYLRYLRAYARAQLQRVSVKPLTNGIKIEVKGEIS